VTNICGEGSWRSGAVQEGGIFETKRETQLKVEYRKVKVRRKGDGFFSKESGAPKVEMVVTFQKIAKTKKKNVTRVLGDPLAEKRYTLKTKKRKSSH